MVMFPPAPGATGPGPGSPWHLQGLQTSHGTGGVPEPSGPGAWEVTGSDMPKAKRMVQLWPFISYKY